ncbi:baculoviral IAP repeat-containing protein 2-like [Saccostrea echinata]|uniref:baculoviral IAP repeat-containing protein 2-like n=1 Tax=Saccostrea echinata TaxID=191078 RepID=UPI002A83D370|nr:baculoviral IAP repeat-containing protein 2-like [Saccostrea echinata]
MRKVDISSGVNQDSGHENDSEGTNLRLVYCSKLRSKQCRSSKISHESKRERFVVCKRNVFPKFSRRKEDKPHKSHKSYVYHSSLLCKHVERIEEIVSKIEGDFKRVPPTALHKESKGVFRRDRKKKCKVFCSSKFGLIARGKKNKKTQEKHSQLNLEKCRIEKYFPGRYLPLFYSRKGNRTVDEIYRKYLRTNPITKRYSNVIGVIKENIRKFEHQYCSKHYQNKIQSGCIRKNIYSNFKDHLKFILFGLSQIRNGFIHLFPVYGISRNLDEFVEREINQNQGSNDQQTFCHSLNLELVRLGSFHNFPSSSSVSTVKLARQGFYYSKEENTVICFACGFKKDDWKKDDNVETIHRAASPNCPLLNSNSTSNIQIGGNEANGIDESCVSQNEGQIRITGSFVNGSGNGSKASVKNEGISRNIRDCVQNHSSNRPPSDQLTKARAQQEKINAFIRDLDPLGINFDRPKYPSYSVLAVRISSFTDWPSSITQNPRDLAIAGFLYAGYGDYTRCFFCGGGLRNWEPVDDPWTEHARWFPKCAFLRQNKGDEFVALVQIEHLEEEALGGVNGYHDDQANGIINNYRQTNNSVQSLTIHPGFQSLLEMGYSSPTIQKAFDLLKETKESINIKAEELLEIVLAEEESTGEDTLSPSASGSLQEKLTNAGKSKKLKADTCKAANSEEMKEGSDFQTHNQRDRNIVSQSLEFMSVEETRSLIEENRKLKDLRLCKICLENEASIAMLPCGHLCCCPDCAPAMRKCPICRQFVKGTVKTWLV